MKVPDRENNSNDGSVCQGTPERFLMTQTAIGIREPRGTKSLGSWARELRTKKS